MRTLRNHSLSLFFLTIFIAALIGQAIAGHAEYNNEEITHARLLNEQPETLSFWRYIGTSDFGQAVMENWQSEYLQFTLFIFATVWFVQKGSPESKELDKVGLESGRGPAGRRARAPGLAEVGAGTRHQAVPVLELAADRDGTDLARLLVRAVGDRAGAPTTPSRSSTRTSP